MGFRKVMSRMLAAEEGVALVVSVSVLMTGGALAAVAATEAVVADSQSLRDRNVKRAVAAADAGIEVGVYRMNKFASVLDAVNQCVVRNDTTGVLGVEAVQADGWCREQEEDLGEGARFSYRVSGRQQVNVGGQDVWQRKVVGKGTVGSVSRRAIITVNAPTGQPLFAVGVFSDLDLNMQNSAEIISNVRSNGNVNLSNSAMICGEVKVGPGKQQTGNKNCAGAVSQATEPFVLAPVTLPASNDNFRLTLGPPGPDDPRSGSVSWDPGTRDLFLKNASITLQGGDYVICDLSLEANGKLVIPDDGTPVRIYIDAPESCGGAGTGNFSLRTSSSEIDNVSGDPSMLQIYAVGSNTIPTTVELNNKHDTAMTIYAPNSAVTYDNQSEFLGAVAARQVSMRNNSGITYDARAGSIVSGTTPLPVYQRQSWVECARTRGSGAPDAGC
jgi:hypothetical protein